jgi:hypothetical protein
MSCWIIGLKKCKKMKTIQSECPRFFDLFSLLGRVQPSKSKSFALFALLAFSGLLSKAGLSRTIVRLFVF